MAQLFEVSLNNFAYQHFFVLISLGLNATVSGVHQANFFSP